MVVLSATITVEPDEQSCNTDSNDDVSSDYDSDSVYDADTDYSSEGLLV